MLSQYIDRLPGKCHLLLLTGFGGHEIQYLNHINYNSDLEHLIIIAEDNDHIQKVLKLLDKNIIIQKRILKAFPKILNLQFLFQTIKIIFFLISKPRINMVSSGDLRNYYYIRFFLWLRSWGNYYDYIPMNSDTNDLIFKIASTLSGKIITIAPSSFPQKKPLLIKNTPPLHLTKLKAKSDFFTIYWIGRLETTQKNPLRAIRIFNCLKSTNNSAIQLYMVGDGPDSSLTDNLIEKSNYKSSIIRTGWIDFNDSISTAKLPQPKIILNTSNYEGIPLTLLDAEYLSIPIVIAKDATDQLHNIKGLYSYSTDEEACEILTQLVNGNTPFRNTH